MILLVIVPMVSAGCCSDVCSDDSPDGFCRVLF